MKTLFIEPGSPWENGYVESFNSKLRDELLNGADGVKAIEDWVKTWVSSAGYKRLGKILAGKWD